MPNFEKFRKIVNKNATEIANSDNSFSLQLHSSETGLHPLWEAYLSSFPAGADNLYRERTEHDCSTCRHFIKNVGGLVSLSDTGEISKTVWDNVTESCGVYYHVAKSLREFVLSQPVKAKFYTSPNLTRFGADSNKALINNSVCTFTHFYVQVKEQRNITESVASAVNSSTESATMLFDLCNSVSEETILVAIRSIDLGLYRGVEHKKKVNGLLAFKRLFDLAGDNKFSLCLKNFSKDFSRIKNSAIGEYIKNIEELGEEEAERLYLHMVSPENYQRSTAQASEIQVARAKEDVQRLGLMHHLSRRHMTASDINIHDVLFINRDSAAKASLEDPTDPFGKVLKRAKPRKVSAGDVSESVSAQEFISDILPNSEKIELFLEPSLSENLISLTVPVDYSPSRENNNGERNNLFAWKSEASWSYNGDVADSLKKRVKEAGGNIDGKLRFSIQWNDEFGECCSDLDAHCQETIGGREQAIYFSNKRSSFTGGELDVDIINPVTGKAAVENIVHKELKDGKYSYFVHVFSKRYGGNGFRAQVEIDGKIYNYNYTGNLIQGGKIKVADVTVSDKGAKTTIRHHLQPTESARSSNDIWGLNPNEFHEVSMIMNSPNFWGNDKIGNRHLIFSLAGCKNPDDVRGFYNEQIAPEIKKNHRKVFEALGDVVRAPYSDDQISGIGISETKKVSVKIRVIFSDGSKKTVEVVTGN